MRKTPIHLSRIALIISAVMPIATLHAQQPTCTDELNWAESFMSRNYSGYADKVTAATRPAYDSLLKVLRAESPGLPGAAACDAILRRWIGFFKDQHTGVGRRYAGPGGQPAPAESPDSVRARFAAWQRRDISEGDARQALTALGGGRDAAEGIWRSADGNYKVAILRDSASPGRTLVMSILHADSAYWMPGQVKAAFVPDSTGVGYRTHFFMFNHSPQDWTAHIDRNVMRFSSGSIWIRDWPARSDDLSAAELRTITDSRFAAYDLAPGTVLVRVPTFNDPHGIDSLFAAEGDRIRDAETLVIDVRGNGGGSDFNYREFEPLLYTGPYKVKGMDVLATDDNIASQLALAADTIYPAAQRKQIADVAHDMEGHRGGWVRGSDGTQSRSRVLDRPKQVAIIVDQGCASSCEQFLLMAKESRKVTLFGDRSGGVLDYANVRTTQMPGGNILLSRPITRSRRLPDHPIDNIGIAPDVAAPPGVILMVPWVLSQMKLRGGSVR